MTGQSQDWTWFRHGFGRDSATSPVFVAARAPKDGIDQKPPKALLLKIFLHAEGSIKNALVVVFAGPGDRFGVVKSVPPEG